MQHTRKSIVLICSLTAVVLFFTGLNLGKYIERVNTTYVPPAPTAAPEPSIQPTAAVSISATYTRFSSKDCGVSFLIPSIFEKSPSAAREIELNSGTQRIFATCNEAFIIDQEKILMKQSSATSEAEVVNQQITQYTTKTTDVWIIRNKKRQKVLFETARGISPLIQQTLELQ